jgi:tripartite motif-containing protein 71
VQTKLQQHQFVVNGRIEVFRVSDGAHVQHVQLGSGPAQISGWGSVALDGQGNVVMADCGNDRMQVLRCSDGAHLRTTGSKGSGAAQFNTPFGVAFDSAGNIIVADTNNFRVQVLRYSDGRHVRIIGSRGSRRTVVRMSLLRFD